ncbi:MAG: tRNA 2-thiouridine(34) synthase MnmA [Candidatus Kryptoniota bacterium]
MTAKNSKGRVVVAMSGGVDSSVAAAILKQEGYDVIGITIKTYNYEDVGGNDSRDSSCCSLDGINRARSVAADLNFPYYVFDFSERFKQEVIDSFVHEYLSGRTPNPCVICNKKIKWEYLLEKADSLGAELIATGHYARIRFDDKLERYILSKGKDNNKDQSYALYGLSQDCLRRTLFPLGEMTKPEVRALAARLGLASANKHESYEICFVADNDYGRFLRETVPQLRNGLRGGKVVFRGKVVGTHDGYPFFTIGQRRGLGISYEKPLFVKRIDADNNIVEVDTEENLYADHLTAESVNKVKYEVIPSGVDFIAKIRYKDSGEAATVQELDGDRIIVNFKKPRRAITPGQSVVIYDGDDVVAGGVIS